MEPKLFRAAEDAAARRDDATAYQLLRRILLEHPTFVPAWISMSKVVTNSKQQRECLERALALDPENKVAHERLEQLHIKELLASVSHVERATHRPTRRKLGDFLVALGTITAGQLRAALGEQSMRKRQGESIQLGELLLQNGLVTPETLAQALVQQTLAWVPAQQQGWENEAHSIERLGDYLIAEHLITPAQLEAALVEQICLRQQGTHEQLGRILVRNGALRAALLEQVLSRQRREFYGKFGE
jgi:hypothetical protein